jgi:4-amino-4-deoxy-L-arabinose transferase-like glycosyltransferase
VTAGRRRLPHLGRAVWLLLALALIVRLGYVALTPGYELVDDAKDYDYHARSIASGEGYGFAFRRPTAFRPPGYPFLLAGVYDVTGTAQAPVDERLPVARVTQALIGTIIVALIGLLAAQLWGRREALAAMALAAVYVPLVLIGGAVMSEPLFVALMLGALCAALQIRGSRRPWAWVLLAGLLAGMSALTRANGLILLLPLAWAAWTVRPRWSARALAAPVALIIVALATVAPWTIRNAVQLHAFVPISTQLGSAMAGTYNDDARLDSENPASWRSLKRVGDYADIYARIGSTSEAQAEREYRAAALHYIREHPLYVAEVAFWTSRRMLELGGLGWARHTYSTVSVAPVWANAGIVCFWVFALLAVAGACTARARRAPWWVWAVPLLMYLSVVFLVVETPRYRSPIDPFIVLLAALPVTGGARRLVARWR